MLGTESGLPTDLPKEPLILVLFGRIHSDLKALIPFMGEVSILEPLIRLVLMIRLGKAYIELCQATEAGSGIGGERGRAAQHAYEDAGAALMAHVRYGVN